MCHGAITFYGIIVYFTYCRFVSMLLQYLSQQSSKAVAVIIIKLNGRGC